MPKSILTEDTHHPFLLLPEQKVHFMLGGRPAESLLRQTGQGPPLLAVASPWSCAFSFRHTLEALAQKFRLLLIDPPVTADPPLLSVEEYSAWLAALADSLGEEKIFWLAQGESALAALMLGWRQPGRCAGLVVLSPPLELPLRLRLRGRWLARRGPQERWARRAASHPFREAEGLLQYADPTVVSRQEAHLLALRWETLPAARLVVRTLVATLTFAYRREWQALLRERLERPESFPAPLFVLAGARDRRCLPQSTRMLLRAFPASQYRLIPDAGGLLQVEKPSLVAQAALALLSA